MNSNIVAYRQLFKIPIVGGEAAVETINIEGIPGSAYARPAESCHALKSEYSYKRSGFYWLQSKCMKAAWRFYCDMITAKDFLYLGETMKGKNKYENIDSLDTIRDAC